MLHIFTAPQEVSRPATQRYFVAALCAAVAAGVAWFGGRPLNPTFAFSASLLAVLISGYFGGTGPAILATLLGAYASVAIGIRRYGFRTANLNDWAPVLAFVAVALAIAVICERYAQRLKAARDQCSEQQRAADELRFITAHQQLGLDAAHKRAAVAVAECDSLRAKLDTSEQRMRMAQQAARLCVYDWDIQSDTVFVRGDQTAFDIPFEQPGTYETLLAHICPEDRGRTHAAVQEALGTRSPLEVEFRLTRKDGAIRWATAMGTATYDESGKAQHLIGIIQDITEHKAAEEAFIQHEKLATAGRLAAAIAHEVNNPLAAVTNLLFIIRGDPTLSDAGRQYLTMAERELNRATQIAKQTLGFYKETAGPTFIDVADLLDEVLAFHARNMPANIKVEKAYAHGLHVLAIAGELHQVFSNLISNAVQAMAAGGTLRVAGELAKKPAAGVRVSIIDDGPGVGPQYVPLLFEPFFTTRKKAGTGLGLWVVKQIVEKHSGTIEVRTSTDPAAHGTTFHVVLPNSATAQPDRSQSKRNGNAA